jgi:hypothetical protein
MLLDAGTLGACSSLSSLSLLSSLSTSISFVFRPLRKDWSGARPISAHPIPSLGIQWDAGTVGCAGGGCAAGVQCSAAKTLPPALFFLSLPYLTSVCAVLTRPKDNDIGLPQDTRRELRRLARLGGVARAVVEAGSGEWCGQGAFSSSFLTPFSTW